MKQVMSFTVKTTKPRNTVAQGMLDRSGAFKPRIMRDPTKFQRKPKHVARGWE
jgi:hypothetical protein